MAAKAFRHNGFANFSGPPRANFSPCIGLSKNTDMKRNWDEDGVDISDDDAPICARVGAVKVEPHRGSKKKCSSKIVPPPSIPSPRPPVPDVFMQGSLTMKRVPVHFFGPVYGMRMTCCPAKSIAL
jgi:hypothetical protein